MRYMHCILRTMFCTFSKFVFLHNLLGLTLGGLGYGGRLGGLGAGLGSYGGYGGALIGIPVITGGNLLYGGTGGLGLGLGSLRGMKLLILSLKQTCKS